MTMLNHHGKPLITPTVHLNGTSRDSLLEELMAADEALNDAYGTLKKAAPNARDYYLGGPSDFTLATTQHMDRLKRLDSVINEIREIIIDVDAQG